MLFFKQAASRVHATSLRRPVSFLPVTRLRAHHFCSPQLLPLLPTAFQFRSNYSQTASLSMSSSYSPESAEDISRILSFWFSPPAAAADPAFNHGRRWFMPNASFDSEIRENFAPLVEKARDTEELDSWTESPLGALALILLLDQFPRNIYRRSPLSYASDPKASAVATAAIARGVDRALPVTQVPFVYMPLMHDERLVAQVACVALFEGLEARVEKGDGVGVEGLSEKEREQVKASVPFARRHLDSVVKFGRFCGRNEVLGRESTEEERRVLEGNPMGF